MKVSQEEKYEEIALLVLADQFGKLNSSLGYKARKYSLSWFIPLAQIPVMQIRPLNLKHNSQSNFLVLPLAKEKP